VKSFLKFVGGKRQLLPELRARVPETYGTYFEPFMGGASLFFDLAPKRARLSDMNVRLVRTFRGLRDHVDTVLQFLGTYAKLHGELFFKELRACPTDDMADAEIAAWFIYVNKMGFNGLWRVNGQDQCNVPFGKHEYFVPDEATIRACAGALQGVSLERVDFATAVLVAEPGDFVYFDPPYVPLSATSSFTSYTADKFGAKDQERLRDVAWTLHQRGVHVLLSNASASLVRDLYEGFAIDEVSATRAVNSDASKRGAVTELLIRPQPGASLRPLASLSTTTPKEPPMPTNTPARVLFARPAWDDPKYDVRDLARHPLPPLADGALLCLEQPMSGMGLDAYAVAQAWGFAPKRTLLHVVPSVDGVGTRFFLIATKGRLKLTTAMADIPVLTTDIQKTLESLAGGLEKGGPFVELFGVVPRVGWHVYGTLGTLSETVPVGGTVLRYSFVPSSPAQQAAEGNPKASTCEKCSAEYFGIAHLCSVDATARAAVEKAVSQGEVIQPTTPEDRAALLAIGVEEKIISASDGWPELVTRAPVGWFAKARVRAAKSPVASRAIADPLLSEAQKIAWVNRAVQEGLLDVDDMWDAEAYSRLFTKVPSSWLGWAEATIGGHPPLYADANKFPPRTSAPTEPMYTCPNCALDQTRATIEEKNDGCASCGTPMGYLLPNGVAKEEAPKAAVPLAPASGEMPFENIGALTNLLLGKRAVVTLPIVMGWTPEHRREALAWASGETKKKPEWIEVKRGRMSKEEKEKVEQGTQARVDAGVAKAMAGGDSLARMGNTSPPGNPAVEDAWMRAERLSQISDEPQHPSFWQGEMS
jgi:DNA adenine methylase